MPKKTSSKNAPPAKPRQPAKIRTKPSQASIPEADVQKLLQELEVHQIELEMQNAELQLARDEADDASDKYAKLYDFAPVGFLTVDRSSTIKMVNLTGASLIGIDCSRLVGRSLALQFSKTYRPAFLEFIKNVFSFPDKQYLDSELLINGSNSRPVTIVAQLSPDTHECQLTLSDITKRKRAEDALQRNFTLFSNLFEQTPIGVFVIDSAFRLQQVNKVALPNFGDITTLLGRDLRKILSILWPKRVASRMTDLFRKTLETGEPYVSPGFRERRRDTKNMEIYEWQIQRLTLPNGEYGVVSFFNNITERQKAEVAQRRLDMLTASNLRLKESFAQRLATAKTLRQSKRDLAKQLKISDRQRTQLRDLSHRILKTQEEERKRISRELHDVVVQSLVGINFQLTILGKFAAEDPHQIQSKLKYVQNLVQHSVDLVHSFARDLRPSIIDDLGLVPALHTFTKHFSEETGINVSLNVLDGADRIQGIESITLYRVAQEALANVARHSKARLAELSIQSENDTVSMQITDNGQGFAANADTISRKKGRLGMLGMKERVEMIGGSFSVRSSPGVSTTIQVDIPFPATEKPNHQGGA